MDIFAALGMTVFLLKITSDGQSFPFMVCEGSDILVKRPSFKNIEKNPLLLNEWCFVHSYFFVNIFLNLYPVWVIYEDMAKAT